jgi:ribokinase
MFDIITFGAAIQDIYIKPEKFKILGSSKFATGKGVCFNLGSKIDIEDMQFYSGGGGTNTASSFAKQGFLTAFCGAVGLDISGTSLIDELSRLNIDIRFIKRFSEKATSHSVILSGLKEDRTIFVYKGASELLKEEMIPWNDIKETRWFYLAPLAGELCNNFEPIVNFAKENNIKIAVNPGNSQLSLSKKTLKKIFAKVNILILNQEEASILTKTSYKKERLVFKKLDKLCPGITIMTKGKDGVLVSDGEFIYNAKSLKIDVADTVGAGDAFASGFVSAFIKENQDIEKAIQLGIANSASCLSQTGAKNGLLTSLQEFEKVKVEKTKI